MLAFEVWIDGERACVAGMEDWSVFTVHVSASRSAGKGLPYDQIDFSVGGLSQADKDGVAYHTRWERRRLAMGSMVTIHLIEAEKVDEPKRRYRSDHEIHESAYTDQELRADEI